MISFIDLSKTIQSISMSLFAALLILELYIIYSIIQYPRLQRYLWVTIPSGIITTIILTLMIDYRLSIITNQFTYTITYIIASFPIYIFVIYVLTISLKSLYIIYFISKTLKTTITLQSIKESIDHLPSGLCFATTIGKPILVNHQMEMLSHLITGHGLLNANEFWDILKKAENCSSFKVLTNNDIPILLFSNGVIYQFGRDSIWLNNIELFQLTATDSTDLYNLGQQRAKDNISLADMNRRLRHYSDSVTKVTRDEEILSTKIKIHDEMGKALLATKRYLNNPDESMNISELMNIWETNLLLFTNTQQPSYQEYDDLTQLNNASNALGITIHWNGDVPVKNNFAMKLIADATRECLTNAARHAQATILFIHVTEFPFEFAATFINNGIIPHLREITEGGGLSSLRNRITREGGSMELSLTPQFRLTIKVPKERSLIYD